MEPTSQNVQNPEYISVAAEEWVTLPREVIDVLNTNLRENGSSFLEHAGEAVILSDTDSKRREKVLTATDLAMAKMVVERKGTASKMLIGISFFEYNDRMVVSLIKPKGTDVDNYNKERADLLGKTNNILITFDQTPLPNYTSGGRSSL